MQIYPSCSLFGGQDGEYSSDVLFLNTDGDFVLNNADKGIIEKARPIYSITISCGSIVDGISVTYWVKSGTTSTFIHGTTFNPPSHTVTFGANEVLVGVFGRAGPQAHYRRSMISNIGFVIFDTVGETVRTVGPFGNTIPWNEGAPFYVSDVMAFGSFADRNRANHAGLSGLIFYRRN